MLEHLFFDNKKAYFKYEILQDYVAGIVLTGLQIKAIRAGKINITEAFCRVVNGEMILSNVIIDGQTYNNLKLLLNRKEINKIEETVKLHSCTIVPLNLTVKVMAKVKIGVGRGKKIYDKRQAIKERDLERR